MLKVFTRKGKNCSLIWVFQMNYLMQIQKANAEVDLYSVICWVYVRDSGSYSSQTLRRKSETQTGRIKSIKVGFHSQFQVDACLISNLPVICAVHRRPRVRPHGLVDVPLLTTTERNK